MWYLKVVEQNNCVFNTHIYKEKLYITRMQVFCCRLVLTYFQRNLLSILLSIVIDWCRWSIRYPSSFWPSDVCESPALPLPRPSSLSQSARNVRCLGVVYSVKTSPLCSAVVSCCRCSCTWPLPSYLLYEVCTLDEGSSISGGVRRFTVAGKTSFIRAIKGLLSA